MSSTVAIAIAAGMAGAGVAPYLAVHGLRHLRRAQPLTHRFLLTVGLINAVVSIALVLVMNSRPAVLPACLVWGWALVAAGASDSLTQRIPTTLVRQATVTVAVLVLIGGLVSEDWWFVLQSAAWCVVAGCALLAAHHFAGAGFGDVRLAALGGLGLSSATAYSVLMGLVVWGGVLAAQTMIGYTRHGTLRTQVALGPGLTAGFLTAAIVPA